MIKELGQAVLAHEHTFQTVVGALQAMITLPNLSCKKSRAEATCCHTVCWKTGSRSNSQFFGMKVALLSDWPGS